MNCTRRYKYRDCFGIKHDTFWYDDPKAGPLKVVTVTSEDSTVIIKEDKPGKLKIIHFSTEDFMERQVELQTELDK